MEIEAREDAARARAAADRPSRSPQFDRERANAAESVAAREWVQRVGFEPRVQSYAIAAALDLRSALGEGAVTKHAVIERMQARWPFLFDHPIPTERSSTR